MTIVWSYSAKESYYEIIDFLLSRWDIEIAENFESRISKTLEKIKRNKHICPKSKFRNLRKCVIHKNASLIYLVQNHTIFIVDVIDNRSGYNY